MRTSASIADSVNFRTKVGLGPSLLLATIRTDSSTTTTQIYDVTSNDIIVLLMGPSGSGKSTFIEVAGGVRDKRASHTTNISVFRVSVPDYPDSNIVLVDTPAFDNADKSDIKILTELSGWLSKTYRKGIRLSGLIYFHPITEPKMTWPSLRNWRAFEKICGEEFNKVVLTTTMWASVPDRVGDLNAERKLEEFWGASIARGRSMKRFTPNRVSAGDVLSAILEDITKSPLQIQREIIDCNITLKQTAAARALYLESEALYRSCERDLIGIQDDLKNPSLSKRELVKLKQEYEGSTHFLKRAARELKDLEPAPERFSFIGLFGFGSSGRKCAESQMDGRHDSEEVPMTPKSQGKQ